MAKRIRREKLYTSGGVRQYNKQRWARYEDLREKWFTKTEARELSRVENIQDKPIIDRMVVMRRSFVTRYLKEAYYQGWTSNQVRYYFYRTLRKWYRANGLIKPNGRDADVWAWYHVVENSLAKKRGWRKGEYDSSLPAEEQEEERVRRRTKRRTPETGKTRGKVKAQRQRARDRKRKVREDRQLKGAKNEREEVWIKELEETAARYPERRAEIERQIRRLKRNK